MLLLFEGKRPHIDIAIQCTGREKRKIHYKMMAIRLDDLQSIRQGTTKYNFQYMEYNLIVQDKCNKCDRGVDLYTYKKQSQREKSYNIERKKRRRETQHGESERMRVHHDDHQESIIFGNKLKT